MNGETGGAGLAKMKYECMTGHNYRKNVECSQETVNHQKREFFFAVDFFYKLVMSILFKPY